MRRSKRPEGPKFPKHGSKHDAHPVQTAYSGFLNAICSEFMAPWTGAAGDQGSDQGLKEHQFPKTQPSSAYGVRGGARQWAGGALSLFWV